MPNTLSISIDIPESSEKIWKEIADWQGQGRWMLQTKVWLVSEMQEGVGVEIAAFTGPFHKLYPRFKFFGLLDLMRVSSWDVGSRCEVIHHGKIIKGTGYFSLEKKSLNQTRFHWSETIESPRWIFLLIAPIFWIGVRISLSRFKALFR